MKNDGFCETEMTHEECGAGAAALGLDDTEAADAEDPTSSQHDFIDVSGDGRISFAEFKFFYEENTGEPFPASIPSFRSFVTSGGYPRFDLDGDNELTVEEYRIFWQYVQSLDEEEEASDNLLNTPSPCYIKATGHTSQSERLSREFSLWYNPRGQGECTTVRPCICMNGSDDSGASDDSGTKSDLQIVIIIAACASSLVVVLLVVGVGVLICYTKKACCFRPKMTEASTRGVNVGVTLMGTPQV
jgi:hypothetical protein